MKDDTKRKSLVVTGIRLRQKRSPHVPAQALGYLIQPIRLLQMLLDAPADSWVTLEVFEDVGLETADGCRTASQVKTGLVKNPLADRSLEFWKTLANWCDAVEHGELDPARTVFEIYVGKYQKGKIATLFNDARSAEAAKDALAEVQKCFAKKPSRSGVAGRKTETEAYANRVLRFDAPTLEMLIQNFRVVTAKRNPLADLRPAVATKWIRPESVELVIQHAHGWIKERLDGLLLEQKPAIISANEFNREILAFLPRCDFRTMVTSMAGLPSSEQVEAEKARTYVRQLEIVDLDDDVILQSINEYLRASVTRTKLAEQGIVHEDSFVEYHEALMAFWRNKKRQNALTHTQHKPESLGQLLFSDCCLHKEKLQGLEMPTYFTPGSYHTLADDETIGWHPDYQVKLRGASA
jgi:hypothetical protein